MIRSHVSIMTTVIIIIISLTTNIKIAIVIIAVIKSDYHNNFLKLHDIYLFIDTG